MIQPLPLANVRVVVTRSPDQAPAFAASLEAAGAIPIVFSTITLAALPIEPLAASVNRLDRSDWLLFTSTNAVRFFFEGLIGDEAVAKWPRIAVSGPATSRLLMRQGLRPEFVPDEFVGVRFAGFAVYERCRDGFSALWQYF